MHRVKKIIKITSIGKFVWQLTEGRGMVGWVSNHVWKVRHMGTLSNSLIVFLLVNQQEKEQLPAAPSLTLTLRPHKIQVSLHYATLFSFNIFYSCCHQLIIQPLSPRPFLIAYCLTGQNLNEVPSRDSNWVLPCGKLSRCCWYSRKTYNSIDVYECCKRSCWYKSPHGQLFHPRG
jgi:hypothetical protein